MSIAPDMLFHMGGVPVGGARFSSPWATHWFVDGTDGNDNNDGKTPGTAKATIQAAVTASTGGDVIYIRPQVYTLGTGFARYTEDITVAQAQTAGSGTEANANKSIIGVTQRQYPSDMLGVRSQGIESIIRKFRVYGLPFYCEGGIIDHFRFNEYRLLVNNLLPVAFVRIVEPVGEHQVLHRVDIVFGSDR